jgi:L-lactate dehydrogenase complex protein LldG
VVEEPVSARDEVLSRIRAALGTGGTTTGSMEIPRAYRARGEHPPGDPALLDLLEERLVDYRATVHRCPADGVPDALAAALALRQARRIAVPLGLPPGWLAGATGLDLLTDGEQPLPVDVLDTVDAVVTGCTVAIAETGTIVLDGGTDQGRRAITLVPDCHVIVVAADAVVQTVPEGLARLDPRRPLTMVSGPSATSDIELNRVEGVHGPRTLIVILAES